MYILFIDEEITLIFSLKRVEISYKGDIPNPPVPLLPDNTTFTLNEKFHNFLLAKS